jgi:serine/threonine protein kinase
MAEVLLARQHGPLGLQRLVAVKRVLPQFAARPEYAAMLWAEARACARLHHPNLVQTYEVGTDAEGRAFVVMEYVRGPDLKRLQKELSRRGRVLPLEHALRVGAEAAAGLHAAHASVDAGGAPLRLVHRDVSPHNLLVSLDGAVKLTDFGIAEAGSAEERAATAGLASGVRGKVSYLSPEAACGLPVDARSDVFSLGVVLFELLTGTLPFRRAQDVETLTAIVREPAPHPSLVRPGVPPDVADLVLRALVKDPARRTPTAGALVEGLEGALARHHLASSPRAVASWLQEELGEALRAFAPDFTPAGAGPAPVDAAEEVTPEHCPRPRKPREDEDTVDLLPFRVER